LFYSNIDDYQTALYYAKQSLYCVKKIKPIVHFDLATVASNVAATLIALKRFESALYYVNQSLFAAKKVDSRVFEEKGLMYKIEIFLALKRYDQAEKLLQLLKKKQLDPISLFNYHLFSLKLSSALEKFDRSNQHINSCDSLLATGLTLTKTIQLNYYDLLQSHYQQIGEEVKQVEALNRYNHFKIAQLEQQKDYRLIRLQLKSINTEKQLAQRALQQQRLKTSAIASSKQNERTYFIISVSFLLLILLVISWSIYLYRKRNKQLREFNGILEELVLEKEVLLREIHHRVKNNFQIINSILSIQSRQKDLSIKSFFAQFSTRIYSMAFVHEKLYGNKVVGQHNAVTFLRELLEHSCATFPDQTLKIELVVSGKAIYLPIEQLLPIGLIVNELTVNSLKYAFPMQENGMIAIAIDQNEHQVLLSFQDNGIGKIDPTMKKTGLIVVDAFVMKLRGTVVVNHEKGVHYQFEFPKQLA
jgi:two-component sensor histidine kinase